MSLSTLENEVSFPKCTQIDLCSMQKIKQDILLARGYPSNAPIEILADWKPGFLPLSRPKSSSLNGWKKEKKGGKEGRKVMLHDKGLLSRRKT